MKFSELLPIGSIVLLKNAFKKLMIIGLMPIKHTDVGEDVAYDYMGVPYPEGYIGQESAMLFMHESIEDVIFTGYSNNERMIFIEAIQKLTDKADAVINDQANHK